MGKLIVGCERSQKVCIAFRKKGIEAYSCDLEDCYGGHPEWHIKDDLLYVLKQEEWDGGIFHPPCTFLTVSANKWLKDQPKRESGALVGKERREARRKAIEFFMHCINAKIKRKATENPIGVMSTIYRKPTQIIQPWMYGHGETKATCLWLTGLPRLNGFNVVEGREQRLHKLPPSETRSMERSETFDGIADAMANQWSYLIK